MIHSPLNGCSALATQLYRARSLRAGFYLLLLCAAHEAVAGTTDSAIAETEERIVRELAVAALPSPLQSFFEAQAGCLQALALGRTCDFDGEHLESGDQLRTHYIMLDIAAAEPAARQDAARSFPRDAKKAKRLFARKKTAGGSLPWALLARHDELVVAMRQSERSKVLVATAGIIRLCVAAVMPFNTTSDREGCDSGNLCWQPRSKRGDTHRTPRRRCQRAMLDRLGPRLTYECRVWPELVNETADPLGAIFEVLLGTNDALRKLLELDRDTCQRLKLTDEEGFAAQEQAYLALMAERAASLWEERLEAGALLAARLVFSAWDVAGKPVIETAVSSDATGASGEGDAPKDAPYAASRNSPVFHRSTCQHAKQIHPKNKLSYATAKDAQAAGRTPCRTCKPADP